MYRCSHSACAVGNEQHFFPTRLLDVGMNDVRGGFKLVVAKGFASHATYTILSHCWGIQ